MTNRARSERQSCVDLRKAAEAVSSAWDAWMENEDGDGQDAVAEAVGVLRKALAR